MEQLSHNYNNEATKPEPSLQEGMLSLPPRGMESESLSLVDCGVQAQGS